MCRFLMCVSVYICVCYFDILLLLFLISVRVGVCIVCCVWLYCILGEYCMRVNVQCIYGEYTNKNNDNNKIVLLLSVFVYLFQGRRAIPMKQKNKKEKKKRNETCSYFLCCLFLSFSFVSFAFTCCAVFHGLLLRDLLLNLFHLKCVDISFLIRV